MTTKVYENESERLIDELNCCGLRFAIDGEEGWFYKYHNSNGLHEDIWVTDDDLQETQS